MPPPPIVSRSSILSTSDQSHKQRMRHQLRERREPRGEVFLKDVSQGLSLLPFEKVFQNGAVMVALSAALAHCARRLAFGL